jgi:hypothetical protein
MSEYRRRVSAALAIAVTAGLVVTVFAFHYLPSGVPPPYPSPSCQALGIGWNSVSRQSGLTYLCGSGSVSDGRLNMTLNSYRFVNGGTTTWPCIGNGLNGTTTGATTCSLGDGVFLLANVTFTNVGGGNTSIAADLGTNVTNGLEFVGNGEYGINAQFPGQNPSQSVPPASGGAFLPPGSSATYWFVFNLPNTSVKDIPNLTLNTISNVEWEYGGDWDGGGGFNCIHVACLNPMADLIVVPR